MLFFKRIFGCEEKCPPNLKEASEDILKKCGGLPLAINAISSLLASHKESREEWERVRHSIGISQGKASEIDAMTYILSLSYFDLPLYLRSCLLYLTMFPEDHLINPQRLVCRWISEGFIHAENAEDLVELGETYLYELINRSLIQPVDIGRFDEKATWCQVHDTILDFLTYKSTEEKFCTVLTGPSKPVNRVRRLSLVGNEDAQSIEQLDLSHARSLGAFGSSREYLPSLARLNALRILDINGCRGLGNQHVKDIGRLLQLRHLDISLTGITELPKEIGDLEYLEIMDASSCPRLVELPESVSRLKRLASLLVSGKTRLPDKIGNMTKLQRLGYINPFMQSLDFLEGLGELANLRNLSIFWDTDNESDKASYKKQKLVSSLCKLERYKLHDLYVSFNLTEKDAIFIDHSLFPALKSIREISFGSGQLCWITKWMVSLVNLQILNVVGGELEQQDIELVGSIPNLLKLLFTHDVRGPIIIGGGFQRLQELEFDPCATTLMFKEGAMPNLKCLNHHIRPLDFKSAHGDAGFNIGMQHLWSLAQVHVRVYCAGVRVADLEAAEGAFKSMANAHPNRPTFGITQSSAHRILQGDERS
ncbi:disease resistance protein RGA5-like [Triticum urartu]|nr:disease resistance protein RGA5-like [Triticum urartu]